MPRVVNEIQEGNLRPTARPQDVYYRPAVGPESRLEKIASSFVGISADLGRYFSDRRKKQEDLEIAQGVELYKKRLAEGEQFSTAEMAEKAKNGDYEGFKSLTKFQKEGIRRARHEIAGLKLQEHMQTWQTTATLPDENGKQVPLDQIADSSRVVDAFTRESARWLMEQTGGLYDPVLAQKYIRDPERSAMNQFIQQQASRRNEQIRTEQQFVASGLMDASTAPIINSGLFSSDPYSAGRQFYAAITHVAETLQQDGVSLADASAFLGQYVQTALRSVQDDDTIDKILAVARSHEFLQNPEIQEQMIGAADYGHRSLAWAKDREKEQKEELARQQSFDLMNGIRTGSLSREQLDAFRYSSPENMAWADKMQEAFAKAAEASNAMEAEQFAEYYRGVAHGDIPWSRFMSELDQFSIEQQDKIWACYTKREERTRRLISLAEAQGKHVTRSTIAKQEKTDRSRVEKELALRVKPRLDYLKDTGNEQGYTNFDEAVTIMNEVIYNRWTKWQSDNPSLASDYTENELQLKNIVSEVYNLYAPNFEEYEQNGSLARKGPFALRAEITQSSLDALHDAIGDNTERQTAMNQALKSGDAEQVGKLLVRYGLAKKENAQVKAAEYIEQRRFLDEELSKIRKQGSETNAGGTATTN